MKKVYELKIALVVDDEHREAIIDRARRCYTQSGGASTVEDDGTEQPIAAEEAIQSMDDALMELVQAHPAFSQGERIEVNQMSCDTEESARNFEDAEDDGTEEWSSSQDEDFAGVPAAAEAASLDDDLDDYEADLYLCRWPNGDFSIVSASSKREAILELDEWAGAHPSQVHPLDSFKADFGLTDEGEIVLHEFGEETRDVIWEICYPELRQVLVSEDVIDDDGGIKDDDGGIKPGGRERVTSSMNALACGTTSRRIPLRWSWASESLNRWEPARR